MEIHLPLYLPSLSLLSTCTNMANSTLPLMPNVKSIQFIRQTSAMLDLPIRTTATAIIYYHRFKAFISDKEKVIHVDGSINAEDAINANEELLATTCLQLACKATEVPRKVRDLVNVGYRYYHSDGSTLNVMR
ncbi:unnamed protein product [Rhizopus microsporus]